MPETTIRQAIQGREARRLLTLQLLGYRRWLPRHSVAGTASAQDEQSAAKPDEKQRAPTVRSAQHDSTPAAPAQTAIQPPTHGLDIAPNLHLSRSGVLITDPSSRVAWYLPPPQRGKDGWQIWYSDAEKNLLHCALERCDCPQLSALLARYEATALDFAALPEEKKPRDSFILNDGTAFIYTFSGWASRTLCGDDGHVGSRTIDWQTRQVQVICLPHPYRCLHEPSCKQQLWRLLIQAP